MAIFSTQTFTPVFTGSAPNDGTGDSLLLAFTKVNNNFANIGNVGFSSANIVVGGSIQTTGQIIVNSAAESTSTTTGALIVAGGAAIGANLTVGGNLAVLGTTTTVNSETVLVTETILANLNVTGVAFLGNGTPSTFSYPLLVATGNVNSYTQLEIQNLSSGSNASSDFIATADTGTDGTQYVDIGINNSGYNVATWTVSGPLDAYLYVNAGSLTIGTDTAGKTVKIHTGGTFANNVVTTFNAANTQSTSTTTGAVVVAGGVGVSANLTAANVVSGNNITTFSYINNTEYVGNLQAVQVGNVGTTVTATTINAIGFANVGNLQAVQLGNVGTTLTATTSNIIGTETAGNVIGPNMGNVGTAITGVLGNINAQPARFQFLRTTNTTQAIANDSLLTGRGDIGNATMAFGNVYANAVNLSTSVGAYAPLTFQPGANVSAATVINGSVEYDGNVFYATTWAGRSVINNKWYWVPTANVFLGTGGAPTLNQNYNLLNGATSVGSGGFSANVGTYEFEGFFGLDTGTVAHTVNFSFYLSNAGIQTIQYDVMFGNVAVSGAPTPTHSTWWNNAGGGTTGLNQVSPGASVTTAGCFMRVRGIVRINSVGYFAPTIAFTTTSPGATTRVLYNSWFSMSPLGPVVGTQGGSGNVVVGPWL